MRVGNKTSSVLPWPDEPLAHRPEEYAGWRWDNQLFKWVQTPMPAIKITLPRPVYPTPLRAPAPELLPRVLGWQWSDSQQEWIPVRMPEEKVQVEKERPPKPDSPPRPYVKESYLCWQWSDSMQEWVYQPLMAMQIARGFICDPEPKWPPGPEVPDEVEGWRWSEARGIWIETTMPLIWIYREMARPPMPTEPPHEAYPDSVPGWVWNYDVKQWMEVIYAEEAVEFQPPLPMLPNQLTQELEMAYASVFDVDTMIKMLQTMGYAPKEIQAWKAIFEAPYDPVAWAVREAVAKSIIKDVASAWKQSQWLSTAKGGYLWKSEIQAMANKYSTHMTPAETFAIAVIAAALIGFIMGWWTAQLTYDRDDFVAMTPAITTYLIGPGDWYYAGCIGVSAKGVPYYKRCESIGATNAHFLRHPVSKIDKIAFTPAGFLEYGYKIPRYIVYRWEYWDISYIGFLVKSGENIYRLQKGNTDPRQAGAGIIYPEETVCPDFRYYL